MRIVAFMLGALLLIGGGALVVAADQQRVAALEQAEAALEETQERLEQAEAQNLILAERLAGTRSTIVEREKQLADTTGLLP